MIAAAFVPGCHVQNGSNGALLFLLSSFALLVPTNGSGQNIYVRLLSLLVKLPEHLTHARPGCLDMHACMHSMCCLNICNCSMWAVSTTNTICHAAITAAVSLVVDVQVKIPMTSTCHELQDTAGLLYIVSPVSPDISTFAEELTFLLRLLQGNFCRLLLSCENRIASKLWLMQPESALAP